MNQEVKGRSPSGPGSQATPEAPVCAGSSPSVSIPNAVWLIWATEGEYSDRSEWPVAVTMDRATGERITERLGQLWREINLIYDANRDALEDANDWCGDTLFDTTAEGREYERLTGVRGFLGGYYSDERSFTCSEVQVLTASGIEAATADETRSGSTEGDSAGRQASPTPTSHPGERA